MRNYHLLLASLVALATSSCGSQRSCTPCSEEVLQETYMHKYGVEVPPDDWAERGKCGQVIATRKDGSTESRNYDQGILHGESTYTFPHSSSMARKENYHQGELQSEVQYYRSGGAQRERTPLSDNDYKITQWYESGEPQFNEEYSGTLLMEGEYYTPDHTLEAQIRNGNGDRVTRDSKGQLISREKISRGQTVLFTTYYPNGSPKDITPLNNGLKNGVVQGFLPEGEPDYTQEWQQGTQHGKTILFDNGERVAVVPYDNGTINGTEEHYRDGRILTTRITWVNGAKHGPTFHYTGDTVTTDYYYNDRSVSQSDYLVLTNYSQRTRNLD